MKKSILFILLLIAINVNAQYTLTTFNHISGYIEIHDKDYFDRMDVLSKQLYEEHIGYYNKAVDYYNSKNFESAHFYFDKAFKQSMFSEVKIRVDNEIFQNKVFYAFMSIIRMPNPKSGDVRNAWQLVDDVCDPQRKQKAHEDFKKWKRGELN